MFKLLKVLPLIALAACQTTGAPVESAKPNDVGTSPAPAGIVSANASFNLGIAACADFLEKQTPLSSLAAQGFNKRLFGSWASAANWSVSTLKSPDVNVFGKEGKSCSVSVSPQRSHMLREHFGRAENALIAKGYKKELRPFGRSGQSTHFLKGSTEFQLTARSTGDIITAEITAGK